MEETLSLELKSDLSELGRLAQIVTEFSKRHQLSSEALFHTSLALEEIVSNVISYGYDDREEHKIIVVLLMQQGELTVEVEDDGRPFNPLDAPEPDIEKPLEERPLGGLGIHLVRNVMDRLEYRRQDGRNLLIMTKNVIDRGLKMDITQDRMNGILILRVSGRLYVATWKTFEEKLLATIDAGEKRLVIDLSQVDHVGSLGLQVFLLAASKRTRSPAQTELLKKLGHKIIVFELQGDLVFASAEIIAAELVQAARDADYLILDLQRVAVIKEGALHLLGDVIQSLYAQGKTALLTNIWETYGVDKGLKTKVSGLEV